MTESKLVEALDRLGSPSSAPDGWPRLGFLRNPFPTKSSPIWNVFHNQAAVRDRFYADLVEFLKAPNPTTTLFITGGNRVGKTHFMEHHRRALPALLESRGTVLPTAVVSAEFANFERLYLDIVDQIAECVHLQTGSTLFHQPAIQVSNLPPGDFRRALEQLEQAIGDDRDRVRTLLAGWVRGERLRLTQRRELGVIGLLDSPSQIQNTFGGLVRYLRSCAFDQGSSGASRTCPGVLVFVDEFELVWRHRRDRRDQFLQSLRALVDECAEGGLFLCVGMATGLGPDVADLEGDYPALFARMKGDREIPALLEIESSLVGIEYAREFERYGRQEFLAAGQRSSANLPSSELFNQREIDAYFREMVGSAHGATVTQADFFDRLHLEAEVRRKQIAGSAR